MYTVLDGGWVGGGWGGGERRRGGGRGRGLGCMGTVPASGERFLTLKSLGEEEFMFTQALSANQDGWSDSFH